MDNTDCWIAEYDFKSLTLPPSSGFASPGPSSGYCSSEENHAQVKVGGGNPDSKSLTVQQRPSESLWRADAFNGTYSLDPYLGDMGSVGELTSIEDSAFDFGTNPPNFDDLMDTFWNPIKSDFPSCDLMTDFDMVDVTQPANILGMAGNRSDPGLSGLSKATKTTQPLAQAKPGWQKRAASPSKEAPSSVKKSSNSSLATSSSTTISAESRNRLKKVFDFQQQIAGLADMVVGDEEEYVLQFVAGNSSNNRVAPRVTAESTTDSSTSTVVTPATQGSALLGGVFSQRGSVPSSLKNCETKTLSRIRGGAVATSCGTLLRQSVSVPNNVRSTAVASNNSTAAAKDSATTHRGARAQNGVTTSQRACARGDMKGGHANASLLALDDHRYTLKQVHSPPAPKSSRGRKASASTVSNANSSTPSLPYSGKMSILEAFLRSTKPFDPNKGSNAALAAEGLAHLRIEADEEADNRSSGTILKKLLTGEIDQSEVHRCEQRVIQERAYSTSTLPVDRVLSDDFGLGAELLLEETDTSNLLCDDLGSDGLWMNAENDDETLSSELDEILREQTRQDNLWLRHYINCV